MISLLKHGAIVKEVVGQVNDYVRDKKPELAEYLVKSFGARVRPHVICDRHKAAADTLICPYRPQIGLEFRDASFLISAKNGKQLAEGMVINLQVAFQNLPAPKGKKDETYALQLIDTVKVTKDGGVPLTAGVKSLDTICFFMNGVRLNTSSF